MAQVSFRGNVGKVRGLQFSQDGKPRFSFSAAESHRRFNKQSQQWEDTGTTWYSITVFGRHAEDLADIVQEGAKQQVSVSGRQETREYEHNGEQRSSLDVVADHVGLIHRANQPQEASPQHQAAHQQYQQTGQWPAAQQPVPPTSGGGWGAAPQGDVWAGGQPSTSNPNWENIANDPPF